MYCNSLRLLQVLQICYNACSQMRSEISCKSWESFIKTVPPAIDLQCIHSIPDTEYDHLDYSRPGSSHKTHYFRMTNPLTNSPKEINVLRDNGTINNLSSPGLSSRQPLVSTGMGATVATGATDYGSSSSNSSPIPPPLCTTGTDSSNLYVKMSSEGSSPSTSDQECNNAATSKIPEHQLNIK